MIIVAITLRPSTRGYYTPGVGYRQAPIVASLLHRGWAGMTTAERSRNARHQLRDRFGRFIDMGGAVSWSEGRDRGAGTFEGVTPEGDVIVRDRTSNKFRFIPVENIRSIGQRARLDTTNPPARFDLDDPDYLPKVIARLDDLGARDEDFDLTTIPRGSGFDELPYKPREMNTFDKMEYEKLIDFYYNNYLTEIREGWRQDDEPPMPKEEYIAEMAEYVRGRYRDRIEVAAPMGVLASILLDGSVRSQFETHRSKGHFDPAIREALEAQVMGVPVALSPRLRPIYGSMESGYSDTPTTGVWYGELAFITKPEVQGRATATGADSIDHSPSIATPLADVNSVPDDQIIMSATQYVMNNINSFLIDPDNYEGEETYAEAQIHGGLPLSDIQAVEMDDRMMRENFDSPEQVDEYAEAGHIVGLLLPFGFTPDILVEIPGHKEILDTARQQLLDGEQHGTVIQDTINALAAALGNPINLHIYG